ncbi:MAG: aminodeoxychorismate synthase component I [Lentisphaeria bacterium]|nr:aminodeoxychorismate synthase component I [Lentisphaeria bacterium]
MENRWHNQVVLFDPERRVWLLFSQPVGIITAYNVADVPGAIQAVENATGAGGLHAAGFISYEAAPAFDAALETHPPSTDFPLVWFGLYDAPSRTSLGKAAVEGGGIRQPGLWTPGIPRDEYVRGITAVRQAIEEGETYQVNYTFRMHGRIDEPSGQFFARLVAGQQASGAAYVNTGRHAICSASPELFYELADGVIRARPMKGTARRGLAAEQDLAFAEELRRCPKNRAENLMIVDMIRNDIGRIARPGSVLTPRLFSIERYPTVWQMTSTVQAETQAPLGEQLRALFPCASITGAPKVQTMRIIRALESTPRKVYTGAIGHVAPGGRVRFNVAIRTVLLDLQTRQAEYGVGGGIVWDSTAQSEYEECMMKARVLTDERPSFLLLETMLWTPEDGWFLLDLHRDRLLASAECFSIPVTQHRFDAYLKDVSGELSDAGRSRIRLLLDRSGAFSHECFPLEAPSADTPVTVRLAGESVDSANRFLYHKTTHREVYNQARERWGSGVDDVLLWNERGELMEMTIGNVVVELDGCMLTPPVSAGLLAGTYRRWLLDKGEIHEAALTQDHLSRATTIFRINSIRGRQRVQIVL